MLAILLTALITFFVSSLFGYVLHRVLHQNWAGHLYQKHMVHHKKLYPSTDFASDKYRSAGKDNTVIVFWIISSPLIIAPIIMWLVGCMPLLMAFTVLIVEGIVAFINNYLHDSFHIKDHWLYRVPLFSNIFRYWVYLHRLHHIKMNTNFGIFSFIFDRLFKTFWNGRK